uniref:Uncharacterized protein n=1 Tax=Daucus carota subsp. sativus TaxID=79200 RepID=A0A164YQB5_DAUCS
MPVLKVLLITAVGSFLALDRIKILTEDALKHLNTVLFSKAGVIGLGPKFMSIYIQKLAIERHIYYDEVEGLTAEWLDATCTLVLNLSTINISSEIESIKKWRKQRQQSGFPGDGKDFDINLSFEDENLLESLNKKRPGVLEARHNKVLARVNQEPNTAETTNDMRCYSKRFLPEQEKEDLNG